MEAWWRSESLKASEQELLEAVLKAHDACAFRSNPSTMVVLQTVESSGDVAKAIAAGILTLGGKHAPLERTYWFLSQDNPALAVMPIILRREKVPGWGGTFQRDKADPAWNQTAQLLDKCNPELFRKMNDVTIELRDVARKNLFPNPSAYTAAAAISLGMPVKLVPYLFIRARLDAWAKLALAQLGTVGGGLTGKITPLAAAAGK